MSLNDHDKAMIEALADEGMGAHIDAVYTPADGGDQVTGVYVIVSDLVSETTGEVTQGGAVLSMLRSQIGLDAKGGQLSAGGETWKINRRQPSTDPSMVKYEASR